MLRSLLAVVALGYVLLPSLATANGLTVKEGVDVILQSGRMSSSNFRAAIAARPYANNPGVVALVDAVAARGSSGVDEADVKRFVALAENYKGDVDSLLFGAAAAIRNGEKLTFASITGKMQEAKLASSLPKSIAAPAAGKADSSTINSPAFASLRARGDEGSRLLKDRLQTLYGLRPKFNDNCGTDGACVARFDQIMEGYTGLDALAADDTFATAQDYLVNRFGERKLEVVNAMDVGLVNTLKRLKARQTTGDKSPLVPAESCVLHGVASKG